MPRNLTATLKQVLDSRAGVIDLMSIMVGVMVTAIVLAGTSATAFMFVPTMQDDAAKQSLVSLGSVEDDVYISDGIYLGTDDLVERGLIGVNPDVAALARNSCYIAFSKSASGNVFFTTDVKPEPQQLTDTSAQNCATREKLNTALAGLGLSFSVPAAPTAPVLAVTRTGLTAKYTWAAVPGATSYRVEYRLDGGPWVMQSQAQTTLTLDVQADGGQTVEARVAAAKGMSVGTASAVTPIVMPAAPKPPLMDAIEKQLSAVKFTWKAAEDAVGYKVETRVNNGTWAVHTASTTDLFVTVTGTQGQTVDVRVSSIGTVETSNPGEVRTSVLVASPTVAPTVTGTLVPGPAAQLSWSPVSGATSYRVTVIIDGVEGASVTTPSTSSTVAVRTGANDVTVRVVAVNSFGDGPKTERFLGHTRLPGDPSISSVSPAPADVTVTWAPGSDATGWEVSYSYGSNPFTVMNVTGPSATIPKAGGTSPLRVSITSTNMFGKSAATPVQSYVF